MNKFPILILILLLAACASQPVEPTGTILPTPPAPNPKTEQPAPSGANADVEYVTAELKDDGTWTFRVTVSHPDTGWEDYADGWDVVLPDGTVVKPDPDSSFTRLLTHPHENEQPFTRSQSGIIIPEDITQVTVRAHDLVDGFGGQEVTVRLDQPSGLNFEVIRPGLDPAEISLGLTHLQPNGNRLLTGRIDLLGIQPVVVPLEGIPVWVVGIPSASGGIFWLTAFADGQLQAVELSGGEVKTRSLSTALPAGMPPALSPAGEMLNLSADNLSQYSHPILTASGKLAYIDQSGQVVIQDRGQTITVDANALPDARILSDGHGQLLVLSDPTSAYDHGVLGDAVEAGSVTLLDESGQILQVIPAPDGQVIEGIMPLWADLDEDGQAEIIITVSGPSAGAQLLAYRPDGSLLAASSAIGTGYRWRNQMAAAPFGPNGELELVDVLTPHLSGTVEFFRLNGERLEQSASISGYTSHVIGSRNLDMALAADLDADGQFEVLLPNLARTALGIIEHAPQGALVLGELPLEGVLSTNLAGVTLEDVTLAIAAGTDNGLLMIWQAAP